MKIAFNNKLEALYAIDYCINRGQNIIGKSAPADGESFLDELYRTYLEKVSSTVRDDVVQLGDFHRKASYVFSAADMLPDLTVFDDFFTRNRSMQDRAIADIASGPVISSLHLDALRSFFGIGDEHEINIVPSMFINSAFGVFTGETNLIIGVNYNPASARYEIADRLISDIYYEFSRPHIQMYLYEKDIRVNNDTEYLVELVTRVLNIVFCTRIYGQEYVETALRAQSGVLGQLRIYLSVYLENQSKIYTLQDYVQLLLDAGLAQQNQ